MASRLAKSNVVSSNEIQIQEANRMQTKMYKHIKCA